MNREILQQALEDICGAKLCEINSMSSRHEMIRLMDNAIAILKAELAKPEQNKPLRLSPMYEYGHIYDSAQPEQEIMHMNTGRRLSGAKNPWVGLTDEEIVGLYRQIADCKEWAIGGLTHALPFAHAIEAKLRSKNGDSTR